MRYVRKSASVFDVARLKRQHMDSEQEAISRIGCAGSWTALVNVSRSFRRGERFLAARIEARRVAGIPGVTSYL